MKVITAPIVTVVGHTVFKEHPVYKVPSDGTPMERLGAFSGKGCYHSFGKDGRACRENQRRIVQMKHGSVLEHLTISFFIEGISRGLSLELNRHRFFNISQQSTRYVKEEGGNLVLDPYYVKLYKKPLNELTDDECILLDDYIQSFIAAKELYVKQVEILMRLNPNDLSGFDLRKWARGKARNVLPHSLETRGTWTSNIRGLRHFLEVRSSIHAEPEIRRLANYMYLAAKDLCPVYFEDYVADYTNDPDYPEFKTEFMKI